MSFRQDNLPLITALIFGNILLLTCCSLSLSTPLEKIKNRSRVGKIGPGLEKIGPGLEKIGPALEK